MERERQLNGAQIRRQMAAAQRHRLDDLLAHLLREQIELLRGKRLELRGLSIVSSIRVTSLTPPGAAGRATCTIVTCISRFDLHVHCYANYARLWSWARSVWCQSGSLRSLYPPLATHASQAPLIGVIQY